MISSPKVYGSLGVKNMCLLNLPLRMCWRWLEMGEEEKTWKGLQFAIANVAEALFRATVQHDLGDGKRLKFCVNQWIHNRIV
jgi:hypothetical protein